MANTAPKLALGERLKRLRKARRAISTQNTEPIHKGIRAGVALFGTNYRINQSVNIAKKIFGISNNKNASLRDLRNSLKMAVTLNDPLQASNQIKQKALRVASNYAATRLGYQDPANVERLYSLVRRIGTLKNTMNRATNNTTRRAIGNDLGLELGRLIKTYITIKTASGGGNSSGRVYLLGVIQGILKAILGDEMGAQLMATINWGIRTRNVMKNPGLSYWNKYRKIADPARFERQRQMRRSQTASSGGAAMARQGN